ncbi:MAG: hypothetical protein CMQ15_03245 [Gammaproteobacteria bacterium]|jgi:hypothetical protein|nr:hypothetical protein [Gammaproteobacteria bacterium]HJN96235.1 hypothetical protein [Gammaproteobacteria bacterium]|tara:strand:- start:2437 stop:2835 length:399 start_codon:yes stop_codon:yes gene_type:complete
MAITTFDTHKFVRLLELAGVPLEQAEVQAEVLTEAFMVNLESLVTKEYLESRLTAKFAEQDARIDTRFAEQDARIATRFAKQDARIDTRFAEQKAFMDSAFAHIDSRFRFHSWTQAIIVAAVIMPYLERLAA